ARGSGADVAGSVWGGVQRIDPPAAPGAPPRTSPLTLPAGLELVTVGTGAPADTCAVVARGGAPGARPPGCRAALHDQIARAAAPLARAWVEGRAGRALRALGAAARAAGALGRAPGAPIATAGHDEPARRAAAAGGVVQPTGAGGGDI